MTAPTKPISRAHGRLTANAMATGPASGGAPDRQALAVARRASGPLESKVIAYYGALPEAEATLARTHRLTGLLKIIALIVGLVALVAGAATLRTAFGADGGVAVNFHWAIASLLGLNTLTLFIWLVLVALSPRTAGNNSLGAAVLGLWRMGVRRFGGRSTTSSRAAAALGQRMGAARIWVASSVSHGLWLAFLTGGVVMALILLSTQQYVFRWETTILSAPAYISLTHALGWLPQALGFTVPDDAAIRAAQWTGGGIPTGVDQTGWASLLFACLLIYGIVPRIILLALSLLQVRRIWRAPLDLSRPEFAALIPHLAPVVAQTRIINPAPDGAPRPHGVRISQASDLPVPNGPAAVIGWEVETGAALPAPPALDLGLVDGAASMRRAIEKLSAHKPRIARLVIMADLASTPDRGVTAGLTQLAKAAPETAMLFMGGAALVERLGRADAGDRLTDWVSAAHAAGIPLDHMIEIDEGDASANRQWQALVGEAK